MNEETDGIDSEAERLDRATSARLRKLRTMPVETAKLRNALDAVAEPPGLPKRLGGMWWRRASALAASLLVTGVLVAAVIAWSARPVLASPGQLAALHEHNVSGSAHSTAVSSVDAAGGVLSRQWPGAPPLPNLGVGQVTACCVHHLGRKKVACLCLDASGTPVSLVIADADDVESAAATALDVNGVTYQVHSSGGVTMLVTEHAGRWVCLMGRLSAERLAEVAGSVRF